MNEIIIHLKFKEYQFKRAKRMGSGAVVYTSIDWVGKQASLIPVPYDVTDKMIERCKDADGNYEIGIPSTHIINKKIIDGSNVGRAYVPKEFIGSDFLIIETPQIDYI